MKHSIALCALAAALQGAVAAQSSFTAGFDGGSSDGFTGNFVFNSGGGNPDGHAQIVGSFFFPSLRTGAVGEPANAAFLGDYSAFSEVTFSLDVKVDVLDNFFGNPSLRPLGISLIDRDIQGPSGASGVFFELGVLSNANQPDWTELSVTISDTGATALPAGWIGFGDENPMTFEPILPAGATFASVLAGVDEVQITGAVPGFFFTNSIFDVLIDNLRVEVSSGVGTTYCNPLPNSTGVPGAISASGSAVAADNDLTLEAANLPPGQFGIFVVGDMTDSTPVGSGVLCIAGSIGRFNGAGQILQADSMGRFSLPIDLTMVPGPSAFTAAMAGDTFYFQAWHRDGDVVNPLSNFTDGLQVDFL